MRGSWDNRILPEYKDNPIEPTTLGQQLDFAELTQ